MNRHVQDQLADGILHEVSRYRMAVGSLFHGGFVAEEEIVWDEFTESIAYGRGEAIEEFDYGARPDGARVMRCNAGLQAGD